MSKYKEKNKTADGLYLKYYCWSVGHRSYVEHCVEKDPEAKSELTRK